MSNNPAQSFSSILLDSIDEALAVLGKEPSTAVYQYLSTIRGLTKDEIPDKIQEFHNGLKQALGGAAKVIERLILRKLYEKLSFTLKESEALEFSDYVDDAKRRYEIFSQKQAQQPSRYPDQYDFGRTSSKKGQSTS